MTTAREQDERSGSQQPTTHGVGPAPDSSIDDPSRPAEPDTTGETDAHPLAWPRIAQPGRL